MADDDSLILPTPLENVDLTGAEMSTFPEPAELKVLIDDVNTVIDAILEWVSGMRMEKG